MQKKKIVRVTTIPISLEKLLENQLTFMKNYYEVIAVSSDRTNLERVAMTQKVRFFFVDLTRKITPFKDLKALLCTYKFFKKEKPFIVHTHTPKAGTIGMVAARLAGVPNRLHTVAGLPLLEKSGIKRKVLNLVEKITYSCATHIYPNSYGLKDIIVKEGFCKEEKLKIIGAGSSNGINTSFFSPAHFLEEENENLKGRINIAHDDFVFIFVGRLVSDKGINELVDVFKQLYREKQKIKLLLVGNQENNLDPLSPQTLEQIKIHPAIITVGFQQDVRPYFAVADALVFPSYREGLPNVVMQAGAMELPSIVSDINGCNEIIKDGVNGLVIPPKNKKQLYNAMMQIIENQKLYNHLKKNTRSMIASRYEQQYFWNDLLKEYKNLEKHDKK